jgi:hypothetical protein
MGPTGLPLSSPTPPLNPMIFHTASFPEPTISRPAIWNHPDEGGHAMACPYSAHTHFDTPTPQLPVNFLVKP